MIKEDVLNTVKKKRFLVPVVLLFLGALGYTIFTKVKLWNAHTFFFAMNDYIFFVFGIVLAIALIISVHCRKFTRKMIEQAENSGSSVATIVLQKFITGAILLILCHAGMFIWLVLLGLCFGAHLSGAQTGILALRLGTECLAGITGYAAALLLQFLFAFPAASVLYDLLFLFGISVLFRAGGTYSSKGFNLLAHVVPKIMADVLYTDLQFSDVRPLLLLLFLVYAIVPLLLAMMIFSLKKRRAIQKAGNLSALKEVPAEPETASE